MLVPYIVQHMENPDVFLMKGTNPMIKMYLVYCEPDTLPDYDLLIDWLIYEKETFVQFGGQDIIISPVWDAMIEVLNYEGDVGKVEHASYKAIRQRFNR